MFNHHSVKRYPVASYWRISCIFQSRLKTLGVSRKAARLNFLCAGSLGVVGCIIVDHQPNLRQVSPQWTSLLQYRCGWVGDTLDVKPTCCHVGCNQNLRISCSAAYLIAVALPPRCETQVNLRLHPVENPTVITHWTWQSWIYGAFNLPDFGPPKASSRARWSFATELNIKESGEQVPLAMRAMRAMTLCLNGRARMGISCLNVYILQSVSLSPWIEEHGTPAL